LFSLVVALVAGKSQVIALRGSYNAGCRRQHIRWSLAEMWNRVSIHRAVYMTVHIHVMKEKRTKSKPSGKKGTFAGYKVSHIEIDCNEQKAPKITIQIPSSSIDHSSDHRKESVDPEGPTQNRYSD
jgi:hypothetical protein